jgi:hypothetical protein
MCNAATCNHTDLNDDLSDFFGDFGRETPAGGKLVIPANDDQPSIADALHYDPCKACGGSGKFRNYSGRIVGDCFKCKGKGKLAFRTSAADRAAVRQRAADKKAEIAKVWTDANPDVWAYMTKRGFKSAFYAELCKKVFDYGSLTERQLAMVQSDMVQDADRAAEATKRVETAQAVDIAVIETVFQRALDNQVARPKLRLDAFIFSLVTNGGPNHGAVYIKLRSDADEYLYLGKIKDGKFFRARDCSPEQEARILAAAANPAESAKAYGQREGRCSICGRKLTKGESIDRFMGPICSEKFGF